MCGDQEEDHSRQTASKSKHSTGKIEMAGHKMKDGGGAYSVPINIKRVVNCVSVAGFCNKMDKTILSGQNEMVEWSK